MFKLRLYGLLSPNRFLCKLEHSRIPNGVLKRSSSINASLRDINPRVSTASDKLCRVHQRDYYFFQKIGRYIENYLPVLTLDPNKFAEKKQPRLCISKLQKFTFHVALQNQSIPVVAPCLYYDRSMVTKRFSCPPDTKAFLYYFTPPDKPRIAGEVRLRVTPKDDPASFESGFDLLKTDGRPWMRPLCLLSKNCIPLYEKLREDQLVPNDLDAVLSTLPSTYLQYSPGQLLYTLNDTFIVDFSKLSWIFTVVTEQGMKKLPFGKPFSSSKFRGKPIPPYTGAYTNHHLSILLD